MATAYDTQNAGRSSARAPRAAPARARHLAACCAAATYSVNDAENGAASSLSLPRGGDGEQVTTANGSSPTTVAAGPAPPAAVNDQLGRAIW
eukprot:SAG31_NODE_5278_length_2636_cov_2.017737_2_plen_92_part_00